MLDRAQARELCDGILARFPSRETELILRSVRGSSLRLAESGPSEQNARVDRELSIRVERDGRTGRARTGSLAPEAVDAALEAAWAAALVAPHLELPPLAERSEDSDGGQDEATVRRIADHDPRQKVAEVSGCLARVRESGAVATGFYSTEGCSLTHGTSRGSFRHGFLGTSAFSSTVVAEDGAGVAHVIRQGADLDREAIEEVGERALDRALASRRPMEIEPGEYRVLLEPRAVGDLLQFLAYAGLGARSFLDGSSFLTDHLGEQLLSPRISLRDDPFDPRVLGLGFDLEGQTRKRVELISGGVAKSPVYDRPTALEAGMKTTGNGLEQPSAAGPQVTYLVLEAAGETTADLLARIDRGLLITQFHYSNLIDPLPVTV
ncbi:MAG: TldD/PmbA family protein, partial [Planctomycetota bacterium]